MNFNSKRTVSDEQNERHKRLLANILKEEGNKSCADCKTRNPTWASVNLGVFVCLTCSGIHRSLGVHISQVRSCNLDTWLPKQVEFCRVMGNVKGNRYWESRLPKDFRRPPSGNPNPELSAFIRAKYVDRAYAATDAQPPTIDNYLNHPYAVDATDSVHSPPAAPATSPAAAATTAARPAALDMLNGTPTKAVQPAAALTVDLLGGFDDLSSVAAMPMSPPAAPASADPFGSFISAPPGAAPATSHLNGLEWTDFYAAAPASSSSPSLTSLHQLAAPVAPMRPAAQQFIATTGAGAGAGGGHHRSHSITEGVNLGAGVGGTAASNSATTRFVSHTKTLSSTQPDLDPYRVTQMVRTQNHETGNYYQPHSLQHHNHHNHNHQQNYQNYQNSGYDKSNSYPQHSRVGVQNGAVPAANPDLFNASPDDLLAGLTIHHVMESMAAAPAAAVDGTFPFSSINSSAAVPSQVDGKPHGRGSQHKRHPSNAKSSEEVIRLFDAEPSTGAAALGGSSSGGGGTVAAAAATVPMASDDPFGDFVSVGPHATTTTTTTTMQNGGGANGLNSQSEQHKLKQKQKQQLLLEAHTGNNGFANSGISSSLL
ncbi:hypothetical protein Vretimale_17986 [Volvox reticuliferus]|uniref:Arf-GAP domain-containing protein n=1 Tax=Volvox reticuliferus TaxID=1737510 RepID=A0A8J4D1J6_9CHLO|nr:hypothetical protein Vretifemale_17617 [Volvox reticuliferus]GIM15184.1 hypothetical protein Vretimale_17986 [Volvox reticuliferus]